MLAGPGLAADDVPEELKPGSAKCGGARPCRWWWMPARWIGCESSPCLEQPSRGHPHPGEAARLLGITSKEIQGNRFRRCAASRKTSATPASSSRATRRSSAGEHRNFVNSTGNPYLARAEAGTCSPAISQGCSPNRPCNRTRSDAPVRRLAAWRGGGPFTARRKNWVVEELVDELGHKNEAQRQQAG